jgi:predicted PurR-regulated permease PerM
MARRQPVSEPVSAEIDAIASEDSGEGSGKSTPSPRPNDSASITVADLDVKPTDSRLIAPDLSLSGSGVIPGTVVPAYIYPFGWHKNDVRRFIGLSIAAIIAVVFLWYVQSILPPFLIAFFLAALFEPTLREFERYGRSRVRAILTLYLAALCLVGIVAFIIVPRVITQATDISTNLTAYSNDVQQSADAFMRSHQVLLGKVGIKQTSIMALMKDKAGPIQQVLSNALSGITGTVEGLASRALWLVIIPLATFFFMRDYPVLRARIITQFPERYHERIDIMSREVMDVFSAYLRGLAKICSLYSVVAIVLYSIMGLRYALILGIFAGIFYAVPYVGQLFTAVGTGLIAYLMEDHTVFFFLHLPLPQHSVLYTLIVVVVAVFAQNVFDQILYPRIVGGSVGLHPVASIFALMSGATLFGIWGMLLAVPVAASIQIIIMYFFPKVRMQPSEALLNTERPKDSAKA